LRLKPRQNSEAVIPQVVKGQVIEAVPVVTSGAEGIPWTAKSCALMQSEHLEGTSELPG
jgi:hypothetical protein